MELNKYNMYIMNVENAVLDDVDVCVNDLQRINKYDDAKRYISNKFGSEEVDRIKLYVQTRKHIHIVYKEDAIEFFAGKNSNQYFSKGWRKP